MTIISIYVPGMGGSPDCIITYIIISVGRPPTINSWHQWTYANCGNGPILVSYSGATYVSIRIKGTLEEWNKEKLQQIIKN